MVTVLATVLVLVTGYDVGKCCCGPHAHGITKSGVHAEVGITAACGPDLAGKMIDIEGIGVRWCEDGGSGIGRGHVDVLMESHGAARKFGKHLRQVTVLR